MGTDRLKRQKIMLPVTPSGAPDYDFMEQYIKEREERLKQEYAQYIKKRLGPVPDVVPLEKKEWGEFLIGNLFFVSGTTTTPPENLLLSGKTPRITCATTNNGLDATYKNKATEEGKVLTVDSATTGAVCYQQAPFVATDHVEKLTLIGRDLSRQLGLFLAHAIKVATKDKYDYGYKFSQNRITRQKIMLPVAPSGTPDWEYMEQYAKNIEQKLLRKYLKKLNARA